MRPERRDLLPAVGEAFRKGWRATTHDLPALIALQSAMAAIVAAYYLFPPVTELLSRYAVWQHQGGPWANGVAAALAGGAMSECSLVYFQHRGRWNRHHLESMAFKGITFFISGALVFEFYALQAYWWGQGYSPRVLIPKVLCDQFVYTIIFAAPYYALMGRWQVLRYSGTALWAELRGDFVLDRLLPMLVMNWMFWIPAITLVYAMPSVLQAPLAIFATAMWGLLVPALTRQETAKEVATAPGTDPELLVE